MPAPAVHPNPDRLAAFLRGQLPPDERAEVEAHVATCDSCCTTLKSLPGGSLDMLARQAAAAGETSITSVPDAPPELTDHPRYRVIRQIGAGGMGVVYLAEHKMMGRAVALKVMSRKYTANAGAVDRFRREVRAAAKLHHPNIVIAHDADEAGGLHFLVMEYVEGVSLDRVVSRRGPQPVAGASHVIRMAAQGLHHAYEKGMVHRDIKPHNLMVTRKGQVKILDFGLARLAQDATYGGSAAGEVTSPSMVMGTPDYLAPEQARNSHAVDTRADVYALGCTLYFLLTGRPPFAHVQSAFDKLLAHTSKPPPDVRSFRTDVPDELADVLGRMMAKDPADRYSTPSEVAQALLPFTRPGVLLDAEPVGSGAVVYPAAGTPVPARLAFTPDPQDDVGTQPVAELTTDRLPQTGRPKRRRKRRAKAGAWGPWTWAGAGLLLFLVAVAAAAAIRFALNSAKDADKGSGGGPPAAAATQRPGEPSTGQPPTAPPAAGRGVKVLFVLPSQGLFFQDYDRVAHRLRAGGATVVTAATILEGFRYHPFSQVPDEKLKAENLIWDIEPAEFNAVVFCGGDLGEYIGGPHQKAPGAAGRIISHMRTSGKVAAAIGSGQLALFWHDRSPDRRVARTPHLEPKKYEMARVVPVDEPVVVADGGKVITAAKHTDAEPFADAILAAVGK